MRSLFGNLVVALVPLFAFIGCGGLAAVTSGQVGCAENAITISDDEGGWGTRTWLAECHGKVYHCSAVGGGHGAVQVSCKEDGATTDSAPPPITPSKGCENDTQCKGNRICQSGQCADPRAE